MKSKYSHLPMLILGSAILAFGMFNIHSRSPVTEGGILGMTLFIQHWFNISPAFSGFVMDVSLFLLGTKYLGKGFLGNAVTASLMFSVFYRIYEKIGYMIREAQMVERVPYIVIIGVKEMEDGTVSVRNRDTNETSIYNLDDFIAMLSTTIKNRI